MELFCGSLFYSIDMKICFYAGNMLLITVDLYYSLKSRSLIPSAIFFPQDFVWLFRMFCVSTQF